MSVLGLGAHVSGTPAEDVAHSGLVLFVGGREAEELYLETAQDGHCCSDDDPVSFEYPAVPHPADVFQVQAVGQQRAEDRLPDILVCQLERFVQVRREPREFVA